MIIAVFGIGIAITMETMITEKETRDMKTFDVSIVRIGYSFRTINVKAKNIEEAQEKALDNAGEYEFGEESSSEYQIDD